MLQQATDMKPAQGPRHWASRALQIMFWRLRQTAILTREKRNLWDYGGSGCGSLLKDSVHVLCENLACAFLQAHSRHAVYGRVASILLPYQPHEIIIPASSSEERFQRLGLEISGIRVGGEFQRV